MGAFSMVFEHSPWVAERAWGKGVDASCDSPDGLHALFEEVITAASDDERLALVREHPRLAAPVPGGAGNEQSRGEQARAGLSSLDGAQRARFAELNEAYEARFGFPFVLAVEGLGAEEILEEFGRRAEGDDREAELATALSEVLRIGRLRLGRM